MDLLARMHEPGYHGVYCVGRWCSTVLTTGVGAEHGNDLHCLNLETMAWKDLTDKTSGAPPQPARGMGMTALDATLVVFGGRTLSGAGRDSGVSGYL